MGTIGIMGAMGTIRKRDKGVAPQQGHRDRRDPMEHRDHRAIGTMEAIVTVGSRGAKDKGRRARQWWLPVR